MANKNKNNVKKKDESKKVDIAQKILNNEDLNLSPLEKENAIKKEEYFRKLYGEIFDLNQTRDFKVLCKALIEGYDCMMSAYKDKPEIKGDIDYIIKFAFRDFYLLIFINMKQIFDNDNFLKDLHKKVYFSENYVNLEDFEKLIDYCKKILNDDKK